MDRMMPVDDNAVNREMTALSIRRYDPLIEAPERSYGKTTTQSSKRRGRRQNDGAVVGTRGVRRFQKKAERTGVTTLETTP
jgi:hypothetical protein